MSETATQPAPNASPNPGSDPAAGGDGGPATPPAGFVPLSEAENLREEARRARQAAEDLRQELARAKSAPTTKPGTEDTTSGFDLDAFRQTLLRDVSGVISLTQTAASAKSEFPNADPALFEPERIAQFSSPEAYRLAVEDSHRRVAAILDAGWQEREAKLREELAGKIGDAGANAGGSASIPAGGDPTPAQLAAMSMREIEALEASNPGVLARVAASVGR